MIRYARVESKSRKTHVEERRRIEIYIRARAVGRERKSKAWRYDSIRTSKAKEIEREAKKKDEKKERIVSLCFERN